MKIQKFFVFSILLNLSISSVISSSSKEDNSSTPNLPVDDRKLFYHPGYYPHFMDPMSMMMFNPFLMMSMMAPFYMGMMNPMMLGMANPYLMGMMNPMPTELGGELSEESSSPPKKKEKEEVQDDTEEETEVNEDDTDERRSARKLRVRKKNRISDKVFGKDLDDLNRELKELIGDN